MSKIHSNTFHQELVLNVKKAISVSRVYKITALTTATIGGAVMLYSTVGNSDFLPMVNVCFRPDESILTQPLDKTGKNKRFCSNGSNILPMLRPYYKKLRQRNFDFATKTAVVNEHDNNMGSTQLLLIMSSAFGLVGCISSAIANGTLKEHKNAFYQLKHSEYSLNEQYALASKEQTTRTFGEYFKEPEPQQPEPSDLELLAASTSIEKEIAENVTKVKEEEKKTAKLEKEINKIRGKNYKVTDDDDNTSLNVLLEFIKNHEDGWLWDLIDSVKPIFLLGEQGSAKTSFAVGIALIREAMGHRVQKIADRHLNGENSDKWSLLKSESKYDNDSAILEMLEASIEERIEKISSRPKDFHQVLLDEFTQLTQIEPKKTSKAIVERFVSSTYSDCRKAHELFIGVTHNFTNASFGDGVYELRKKGWLIEKFANKKGDAPLPRICIRIGMKDKDGNLLEDENRILPNWFQPEIIHDHLNGKKQIEF